MAEHQLYIFNIKNNRGSGYNAGDIVSVVWDDSDSEIKVYKYSGIFDTEPDLQTSGPSLGIEGYDYVKQDLAYRFCNGSTYTYFNYTDSTFPYARKRENLDSPYCYIAPTCDLIIDDEIIITSASDSGTKDGTITISAESSNGVIKAALYDFNYSNDGTALTDGSITFEVFGGKYTVYTKDALGCTDTVDVVVPIASAYGHKYTIEWDDLHGRENQGSARKIEIYQRSFTGSPTDLTPAGEPYMFRVNADAEDIFHVIRATSLRFTVVSTFEGQFREFFTQDDREWLIKDYIGGSLNWQGYIIPFLYTEQYLHHPYYVEVEATDGLANLKDLDFVDTSGNQFKSRMSAIKIMAQILKKLDISTPIRSAVNMFETSMNQTATDDPLAQAYYDPTVYYNGEELEKCSLVVQRILAEYRAVITQADGVWLIYRPEELIASFNYREFSIAGDYSGNGSINPILTLGAPSASNRLAWKDRSQTLNLLPSYGTFIIKQSLLPRKSLLPSYSFEEEDLNPVGNGLFFKGWNISVNTGASIKWGLEKVDREDSQGALYINFGWNSNVEEVTLYTLGYPIQFKSGDKLKFSFDYLVDLIQKWPWYTFQYKLKIGDFYLIEGDPNTSWDDEDPGYRDIEVTEFNTWRNFSVTVETPNTFLTDSEELDGTISLYFQIGSGKNNIDESDLRAIDTTVLDEGAKELATISVPITGGSTSIRGYYELTLVNKDSGGNFPDEDVPNLIYPNDHNGETNPVAWVMKGADNGLIAIESFLLDNVVIEYLPDGVSTPTEITTKLVYNRNNKRTLEFEMFHGDCPADITNAKNVYRNIIKRLDSNSGSYVPTELWKRNGFFESNNIQQIALKTLVSQFRNTSRRLTGNLIGDVYLKPYSVLQEDSRLFLAQGYSQMGRLNEYNVDLYNLKDATSTDDGANGFSGAFDPQQFGTHFD